MITGEIKNKIDQIWDTFFVAGITNLDGLLWVNQSLYEVCHIPYPECAYPDKGCRWCRCPRYEQS